MTGVYKAALLNPASMPKTILPLIKGSFKSKIMNIYTSYIVVETQAQKNQIKLKQKQILSNIYNTGIGDEVQRMSEPPVGIIILLLILIWGIKKRKTADTERVL